MPPTLDPEKTVRPRLGSLTERRWAALDWATVAVLGAWSAAAVLHGQHGGPFLGALTFFLPHGSVPHVSWVLLEACVALAAVPVGLRRDRPLPVLLVSVGAAAVLTVCGRSPLPIAVLVALAGYAAVTRLPRPAALRAVLVCEAVLAGAFAVGLAAFGAGAFGALVALAAAWFVADSVASRRAYLAGEAEQKRQQGIIEAQRARETLREERMAIARELHDVVAHSLTVMGVQAGVGRRLMGQQPEQAESALRSIEETARAAHEELRVVLGLLRDGSDERVELAPAPGLADLEGLARTLRAAGTPVDLRVAGDDRRLTPALQLVVYRVVQEALTNVARHAPGAEATVGLTISGGSINVVVANNAGAPVANEQDSPEPAASQHGIVGMRERVAAFGGTLTAERLPEGFRVSAVIPLGGAT